MEEEESSWFVRKRFDGSYSPQALSKIVDFYHHCLNSFPWLLKRPQKLLKVREGQKCKWAVSALTTIYGASPTEFLAPAFVSSISRLLGFMGENFLDKLLPVLQKGKLLWNIKHNVLKEVSDKLCDPMIGVTIVALLKLSWKQWTLLITLFRKKWSPLHQGLAPISLLWGPDVGERTKFQEDTIPRLLPALLPVKVPKNNIFNY